MCWFYSVHPCCVFILSLFGVALFLSALRVITFACDAACRVFTGFAVYKSLFVMCSFYVSPILHYNYLFNFIVVFACNIDHGLLYYYLKLSITNTKCNIYHCYYPLEYLTPISVIK